MLNEIVCDIYIEMRCEIYKINTSVIFEAAGIPQNPERNFNKSSIKCSKHLTCSNLSHVTKDAHTGLTQISTIFCPISRVLKNINNNLYPRASTRIFNTQVQNKKFHVTRTFCCM